MRIKLDTPERSIEIYYKIDVRRTMITMKMTKAEEDELINLREDIDELHGTYLLKLTTLKALQVDRSND